jgi:hypothetical protein
LVGVLIRIAGSAREHFSRWWYIHPLARAAPQAKKRPFRDAKGRFGLCFASCLGIGQTIDLISIGPWGWRSSISIMHLAGGMDLNEDVNGIQ